jgi:HSP20 family protein
MMSFPGRSPFTELDRLREEVSRIVTATLSGSRWVGFGGGIRGWSQDVEVDEADDAWTVTVRLPGVAAEEVQVELEERELRIRARRAADDEPARARSSFHYRLTIPSDVDIDAADATMDHGLLVIRLPRTRRGGARQIAVRPGTG